MPITDVAQVQFSAAQAGKLNLAEELRHADRGAAPALGTPGPNRQTAYLLVPTSAAGAALGQEAKALTPEVMTSPSAT